MFITRSGDLTVGQSIVASCVWQLTPVRERRYRDDVARHVPPTVVVLSERLGFVKEIRAPACVIVGDADLIKGPAYAETIHRGISGRELHVIHGAGHATCWEAPQCVNEIVVEFLRRQG